MEHPTYHGRVKTRRKRKRRGTNESLTATKRKGHVEKGKTAKAAAKAPRTAKEPKSRGNAGKKPKRSGAREHWQVKKPHAAGIDIGSREHWVSVGRQRATPQRFGTFTPKLDKMVEWLNEHGIKQAAMELFPRYVPVCLGI